MGRASTFMLNKQIYEGEFRDGVAHGKGVMLWEDGQHYDGEWVDGRAHGNGLLTFSDGSEKKGPFVPCSAKWYTPLKVNKTFWPGQLLEAELTKLDRASRPAYLRAR